VDAARKANSSRTWKEVSDSCVQAEKFRLASVCGLRIIQHGDEIDDLIAQYERRGFFEQIIDLLEKGIDMEGVHISIFTLLAVIYSRYKEDSLMAHLKRFGNKINVPRVSRIVEQNQQWRELVQLYIQGDEHDNAVSAMMAHSADAFDHDLFLQSVSKVCVDGVRVWLLIAVGEYVLCVCIVVVVVVVVVVYSCVERRVGFVLSIGGGFCFFLQSLSLTSLTLVHSLALLDCFCRLATWSSPIVRCASTWRRSR
jgi:Region in Clathrin and VPS